MSGLLSFRVLMSTGLRSCYGHSKQLLGRHALGNPVVIASNSVFGDAYLGIDHFLENRNRTKAQFGPMRVKFFERMKSHLGESSDDKMMFTEDLKNMTYLLEDTPEDQTLFHAVIKKFNSQNKDLRFGSFVFGPVVMRLLHHFKNSDLALQLLKDPACDGFFDQMSTFVIVAHMLYDTQKYQDVLDLYELMVSKQFMESKFPRDMVTLVIASCYKMNTPESYAYAKDLIQRCKTSGALVSSKSACFLSALALNQADAQTALESLSLNISQNLASRNLKILSLVKLGRPEDALMAIRVTLNMNDTPNRKREILHQVMKQVEESVVKMNDKEITSEFYNIYGALKESNLLRDETVDQLLDQKIEERFVRQDNFNNNTGQPYDRRSQIPEARYGYNRTDDPDVRRRQGFITKGYRKPFASRENPRFQPPVRQGLGDSGD